MAEFWLGDSNGPMGDVGAFMASELRVDRADLPGHIRQLGEARVLVAVTGAPGAGEVQLAREIAEALNSKRPESAALLPLEGFADDDGALESAALCHYLAQMPAEGPAPAPLPERTQVVLVAGPQLLRTSAPLRDLYPLFDLTIRLVTPGTKPDPDGDLRAADLVVLAR
ncbi:hypothetical protein C8J27_10653 [Rhodobacter aestuarii]|uniref:Uncharacterized protein n=1 Tax=Rhodobacter aestuarii TaxID=453582 RepID=A0A1N7M1P8_9RHOB|nr:hypothetical protein [Rhodobacter aestuarii]PTV94785.1 hypothetical protein C8J27_10653 [Rhodobacter aestuarii]SIS80015.1 hypothetical protein SAMN05421580_10553 [Rhodobacter aestuarii]